MTATLEDIRTYLRPQQMPHILCPGCGHGIVLQALLRAVHSLGLDRSRVAVVAGIGCSSRLAGYIDFCTLHTTHGRAPAFATGLKLARPELTVIVITGDGDGLSIGASHLIHAARRNIGLFCILFNNETYGMTGGQHAPTTGLGRRATTAPSGNFEPPFDAAKLLTAAGATFVARGLTYEPWALEELCREGLAHEGFAFLEVVSDCPEYFGRYNALGRGPEMIQAQKRRTCAVAPQLAKKATLEGFERGEDIEPVPTGILHRSQRPELSRAYRDFVEGVAK
jgi:2-oxoglutarate ferredoxin oxidoreductase subunit beta